MTIRKPSQREQSILDSIHARTGLSFRRLGGVDTAQPDIAAKVLPVLREWVPLVTEPHIRHGIYSRFDTPFAVQHVDDLLSWWQAEEDALITSSLTMALTTVVTEATAARVWGQMSRQPITPSDHGLVARLASFPEIADRVLPVILSFLDGVQLRIDRGERVYDFALAALISYSRVPEHRVREWFARHANSGDSDLRGLARKANRHGLKLSREFRMVAAPPDPSRELYSAEVTFLEFGQSISGLADSFGIQLPATVRTGKILDALKEDLWVVCRVQGNVGSVEMWLRREDFDTVEVWFTRGPHS